MLALEVEFLTGVSVAATPSRREEAEWPPHPDRLFLALIAAWGRNEEPDRSERDALEWLEGLDPDGLVVSAPAARGRNVVPIFVPPNDARTARDPGKSLRVIPEFRKNRQPRTFPATLPLSERPVVRYTWKKADGMDRHRMALKQLAAEVTYLGHSHSLVRVALIEEGAHAPEDQAWIGEHAPALRMPYKGRLAHVVECYSRVPRARPNPSLAQRSFGPPTDPAPPHALFDGENPTILADDGGFAPALEAFPLVAKRLRDAFLWTAERNNLSAPLLLSGHDPDGSPTVTPHIAVVPLADVGWTHSGGRLMGVALLWPVTTAEEQRERALKVLAAFLREGFGELHFGRNGTWRIGLEPASDRASLRVGRYARASRRWGTVLPVVLDRHPKNKAGEDLAAIVTQACLNIGLPEQAVVDLDIEIHKYSPISGAPPIHMVIDALAKDSPYRGRLLRHMVLTFARPIRGPLVLGAGRFRGLGLCLPLGENAAS